MLIVLTKLGSPELVGQFALGLAITAPIMIFADMRLRAVQVADARNEYKFGDYLSLRMGTTALALLVIAGFALFSDFGWEMALIILALGAATAFESISDVFYGLLQKRDRMDFIAKSKMIKGPLSLLALGLGFYLTGRVVWGVMGLATARAFILAWYDLRISAYVLRTLPQSIGAVKDVGEEREVLRPRWDMRGLAKLLWLALPLGIVALLISLRSNVPRYFIEQYLGARDLGIFVAIAYLMIPGVTVATALGESASPRLAKYYEAGNGPAFRGLLLKLVGIGALIGIAGVLAALTFGREILSLLYGPEYARLDLFRWMTIAAGISYVGMFLGYGILAARYFRVQMVLLTSVVATLALACLWLVPLFGLGGAAAALVITSFVHASGASVAIARALSSLHGRSRSL